METDGLTAKVSVSDTSELKDAVDNLAAAIDRLRKVEVTVLVDGGKFLRKSYTLDVGEEIVRRLCLCGVSP
jgi:hypothetical protein